MGWRDICRSTAERTVIASVLQRVATGDTLLLTFLDLKHWPKVACRLADQCSLVHDNVARQKFGRTHLKYHVKKELPNLPPDRYTRTDAAFIVPRVLELTCAANDLKRWAAELGYDACVSLGTRGAARLRAELDYWYASLYGLTATPLDPRPRRRDG